MPSLEIHQFPCLSDNYGYLIHDAGAGVTAAIDTPDVEAIETALNQKGWQLTHILNTHHHYDHAGGNEALKAETGCTIIGPEGEKDKIPGIDRAVAAGDTVLFGPHEAHVLEVPGHTLGHIAYHFPRTGVAFVGDALFALGCGRVFEGTMDQMWTSMETLMTLPEETVLYCAHEYTQANARFAETIEPGNTLLKERIHSIDDKRSRGEPTVPTTLKLEKATNPFLRPDSAEIQKGLGLTGQPLNMVFAEIRRRKDTF